MNKEKLIEIMDCMLETEWNIEALEEISLLLMDAFRTKDVAVSGKLFYCYHLLLGQAGKRMEKSMEMLNDVIIETSVEE